MAKQEQINILLQGQGFWKRWREEQPNIEIDFSQADLSNRNLSKVNLSGVNLNQANLRRTNLCKADLSYTNLREANLYRSDLSRANLRGGDLRWAILSGTDLRGADITGCSIYAISAWNILLEDTKQANLIITNDNEATITSDNIELAQFIYLLLNNQKIHQIIDTITSKVVLILERFTPERKSVLDTLKNVLRNQDYSPIIFDFEKPESRDLTEAISILAHLARFIIVDLTDPSSVPHEVATIVPQCIVPVQPLHLLDESRHEYAMFEDLRRRYHWVLPTYYYRDIPSLLTSLPILIIPMAEQKARELTRRK